MVCSLQPLSFAVVHVAPASKSTTLIKKTVFHNATDDEDHNSTGDEAVGSAVSRATSVESTASQGTPKPIRRFGQTSTTVRVPVDLGRAPPTPCMFRCTTEAPLSLTESIQYHKRRSKTLRILSIGWKYSMQPFRSGSQWIR